MGLAHLQPRFEKDDEVALEMQLYARKREAVVATIAALSKDPAFGEVDLRSETAAEPGAPNPFQFILSTPYEPDAGHGEHAARRRRRGPGREPHPGRLAAEAAARGGGRPVRRGEPRVLRRAFGPTRTSAGRRSRPAGTS